MSASVFAADAAWLESEWGIALGGTEYLDPSFKKNFRMALDAQPTLVTNPNGGIPAWMTQFVDPDVVRILQTPNLGASILGEEKKGVWTDQTAWFPVVENTGQVASYGDYNTNGRADVNIQFESRQSYLFQVINEIGDLEADRAGEALLSLVSEKQMSAAKALDKFLDYTYHFGVAGLSNYGLLNDPSLPAAITPTTKQYGGVKWVNNGQIVAQASEVYADFQTLFQQATSATYGVIDMNTRFKFVMPNAVNAALTAVNSFGITVRAFIKESFPNVEYVVDPRYATASGNVIQLIALDFDGHKTGTCSFNEKLRDHTIVRDLSSFRQKKTSGTWGAIIKYPLGFAQMIGV
jgi:hypothetical protein